MFSRELIAKATHIIAAATLKQTTIATAESCTGGLIASILTEISGSSKVFGYGLVTYSNIAKTKLLGIDRELVAKEGAVSSEVAATMAECVRELAMSDIGIGVTGIAGPEGGSEFKPVGLVYVGYSYLDKRETMKYNFSGNRSEVRLKAVESVLDILNKLI